MNLKKVIFIKILFFFPCWVYASDNFLDVLSFKNYTRIILKPYINLVVKVNIFKNTFDIILQNVTWNDLGFSKNQVINLKKRISLFQAEKIKNLSIYEDSQNIKITGDLKFPSGEKKLVHEEIEYFFYKISNSREYIIDFWFKESVTIQQHRELKLNSIARSFFSLGEQDKKKRILEEKRNFSIEKEDHFSCEKLPFENKIEVYLEFKVLHRPVRFEKWFSPYSLDTNYAYKKPEGSTREEQYLKYALSLMDQSQPALALRTLDFLDDFMKKENTKYFYEPEISFLKANLNLRLGFHKTGKKILKKIIDNFKNSEESFRSAIYLFFKKIEATSSWINLENFQFMLQYFSDSKFSWIFHLGAAESYYELKQTESALKEYEWVLENAPDADAKAEALFRIGDLYLDRKQYEQAFFSYAKSIRTYPKKVKDFPEVYLNQGESLYQLSQLHDAHEVFKKFLENHSNHPSGWRATFRIGEIYDLTSRVKEDLKKGRKWYYETINRYPHSPGVTLARLKLAPCLDHGGLNTHLLENFFSYDAEIYTGNNEVEMHFYPYFRSISHIKYIANSGETEKSLALIRKELSRLKKGDLYQIISSYFIKVFKNLILNMIKQKRNYEAIRFYNENESMIMSLDKTIKNNERSIYDQNYLLVLAEVALNLNLKNFSIYLIKKYESFKNNLKISNEKTSSQENFIIAKYLWMKNEIQESKKNIIEIKKNLNQVSDDFFYSFGKHIILSLIASKENDFQASLFHALQTQIILNKDEENYEEKRLRIEYWIASIYLKMNNLDLSYKIYSKIEKKINFIDKNKITGEYFLGLPQLPSFEEIILTEGDILERLNQLDRAREVYSICLKQEVKDDQIYYKYAKILSRLSHDKQSVFSGNKIKKEIEDLNKYLKNKNESFWKKLTLGVLNNI